MSRYENSIIYKICCRDPNVTDCYIGSCCNFARRKSTHKYSCNHNYGYPIYNFIRENGGWDNFQMIQLLSFSCNSKRELELKEREYIELLKPTLNKQIPTRTKQEYYEQNKDLINEKHKEYYELNKEKIKEIHKEYYEQNKDKINEHNRDYYEQNKEKFSERSKEYRKENIDKIKAYLEANREKIQISKKDYDVVYRSINKDKIQEHKSQKFLCQCGVEYTHNHKSRHEKTKIHIQYIDELINERDKKE